MGRAGGFGEAGGSVGMRRAKLSTKQIADLIFKTRWADEFDYPQIELLARHGMAFVADTGVLVLREGAHESFVGLIIKGEVEILKKDSKGRDKLICKLGTGKTFGEMSMIDAEPRSASAKAIEETVLFCFNQKTLFKLAEENPVFSLNMLLRITKMISQRLRQTSGRLIDHLEA